MLKRREEDGFNLAFLDVMACGLGAVILIFMLVKFEANTEEPVEEVERLRQELTELMTEQEQVKSSLAQSTAATEEQSQRASTLMAQVSATEQSNAAAQKLQDEQQKAVDKMIESAEQVANKTAQRQAEDKVKLNGIGEESYLLGLKVEGKNIGILLDVSASMTDEKLIDIINHKISSNAKKRTAAKWKRTKRVAKWLLARVPNNSKVSMVSFNDKAQSVGAKVIVRGNDKSNLKKMARGIDRLTPNGGTNLQKAITKLKSQNPAIDALYVITDGLPTLGDNGSGLKSFSRCGSFFGKSTTITGDCRFQLFNHTVGKAKLDGVKVNVILLPLEGDPGAADAYWQWSASTGGLFISPARSWP